MAASTAPQTTPPPQASAKPAQPTVPTPKKPAAQQPSTTNPLQPSVPPAANNTPNASQSGSGSSQQLNTNQPPGIKDPSAKSRQLEANRDATKVRDPNADERPSAKKAKVPPPTTTSDPVIKPPPAHLLQGSKGKPQTTQGELPIDTGSPSTPAAPTRPSIAEATKRLSLGQATPLDMEVINEWGSQKSNQVAMVASYFDNVRIDGLEVVATQSIARMAEGGGNPTSTHRGPRGRSSGVPQGRGSQPGDTKKIDLPSDDLDLSSDPKMVADALARATEKAAKDAAKQGGPLTIDELRKRFGSIP